MNSGVALSIYIVAATIACGTPPPSSEAPPAGPNGAHVPAPTAESVIRGTVQPGVRNCYNDALRSGLRAGGTATLVLHVAPDGSVDDAPTTGDDTLPESLLSCIRAVGRSARFAAPGPPGATLTTKFDFEPVR